MYPLKCSLRHCSTELIQLCFKPHSSANERNRDMAEATSSMIRAAFRIPFSLANANASSTVNPCNLPCIIRQCILSSRNPPDIENVCQVICRRQPPVAAFVHQEGEVLVVVIGIFGQYIEDHPAKYLFLGSMQYSDSFRPEDACTNSKAPIPRLPIKERISSGVIS